MNELIKDYLINHITGTVDINVSNVKKNNDTDYLVTYTHRHKESNTTYEFTKIINLEDLLVFMYKKIKTND
jgi:hypothetical protein